MIGDLGFGVLCVVLLMAAIQVVSARDAVRGVLWLGVTLLVTAGLYVTLRAPFLAGMQLLLYVGGVMTLMILGVMLTPAHTGGPTAVDALPRLGRARGVVIAGVVFGVLATAIRKTTGLPASDAPVPDTAVLGQRLLTEHALAFEVLSLLLLAAMIGAIVLVRRDGPGVRPPQRQLTEMP